MTFNDKPAAAINTALGFDIDSRCTYCDALAVHFVERNATDDPMCHAHFSRLYVVCTGCDEVIGRHEVAPGSRQCAQCDSIAREEA